ncbi:hypothetical protein [Nocardioides alcanivorans]|uniref:hypothetical protein n=1 Tax=Nocardioides alcanivorans TaxID=2897352 RepID=UPI001F491599|nr:hypothetical protein [Nocardioides alcanivorans]
MTTRLRRSLALPLLLLVALCGCVNLPEESDVEVRAEAQRSDLDTGFPYQPRPPQAGRAPRRSSGTSSTR